MTKKLPKEYFEPLDEEEKGFMKSDEERSWADSNLHTLEDDRGEPYVCYRCKSCKGIRLPTHSPTFRINVF